MPYIIRGSGDKEGEEIICSSLTDLASQTERGRNEIEINHLDKNTKVVSLLKNTIVLPGTMCQLVGKEGTKAALTTGFSINYSTSKQGFSANVQNTFETIR